jgi:hypothetical protein
MDSNHLILEQVERDKRYIAHRASLSSLSFYQLI